MMQASPETTSLRAQDCHPGRRGGKERET